MYLNLRLHNQNGHIGGYEKLEDEEIAVNETMRWLEMEASVTNAENGQLVRAFASTILHKRNIRMDFSLPSPAVIHPDMPFMAWVIIDTFRILFSLHSTFLL